MLVQTEKPMSQVPKRPMTVLVHSSIGVAEVLWRGDPQEPAGPHHIEWSVDEDVFWGRNTVLAAAAEPGLRQDGDRVVLRGRLYLTADGAAVLELGESQVLFDLASPPPDDADGAWVEISVATENVAVWPFQL
jgi:hypothetical protein